MLGADNWHGPVNDFGGVCLIDQLHRWGIDLQDTHLICIETHEGQTIGNWPAFQFHIDDEGRGRPIELVLEVNKILNANEYPFIATSWWLNQRNAWLDGRYPVEWLADITSEKEPRLLNAARAKANVMNRRHR